MGTWGVGISANDEFQDVKDTFFYFFYHEKISVAEIENKIFEIYSKEIPQEDSGEWHNVYFALAYCEWKCGCLSGKVLQTVEQIIDSGKDSEYWKELNADNAVLKKRADTLRKFSEKLKTENKKPLKRRYKKPFVFPLKTGDVFACYSKANSCYGCGVVLEVRDSQLKPHEEEFRFRALIALSEYTPKKLPTVEQVINSNALDVFWNGGCTYNLPEKGFVVLGNIADRIDKDYSEYFGSFKSGGRIYSVGGLRPDFDRLISADCTERVTDNFSLPDKPMPFFFDKSNLQKTDEILKIRK